MTVATSLDSLLEKLKVEELYLPPSNWESLHSQSRQFPPPTRASPPSSSSVSESSLVRLALNALQGVESSLISIHKLSSVLCSEPANRTTHQIPSLWHRTHFRNFKLEVEGQGGDVLKGYISGLDTLCASAELRRSSNIVVYTSAFWITGLLILDNKRFSNVRKYVAAMIQQPRVPSSGLMPASDVLIRAKETSSFEIPLIAASTSSGSLDPLNPQYSPAATCVFFDVARTFSKSNQELSPNPTVRMA
ncbi:hypothetical protein F2Q68_00015852 [Brassica cretica]|uniref:Uncharacterized protein n=1 Tax=Brassica cretica TaxID=69181 RepID=A0A8S9HDE0_BRACR|nr:hypothetical protein F2Q68_00015852 [Brassica cretica]